MSRIKYINEYNNKKLYVYNNKSYTLKWLTAKCLCFATLSYGCIQSIIWLHMVSCRAFSLERLNFCQPGGKLNQEINTCTGLVQFVPWWGYLLIFKDECKTNLSSSLSKRARAWPLFVFLFFLSFCKGVLWISPTL